nr:hypothetical protein [Kibdelosporangium sp. MJ126-NF4]
MEGSDEELAMVLTASCLSGTEVIIESFSRDQMMAGGAMAYLSMVVVWLARDHLPNAVLVNGVKNHPFYQ